MAAIIDFANVAKDQIHEIYEYIREKEHGLLKVQRFNIELINSLSLLEENPKMGTPIRKSFRYIIIGNYRFTYFYKEKLNTIIITRIFHVSNQSYNKARNLQLPDDN